MSLPGPGSPVPFVVVPAGRSSAHLPEQVHPRGERRQTLLDQAPQPVYRMSAAQMVQNDGLVSLQVRHVLHQVVEVEVLVGAAVLPDFVAEKRALDHQHPARAQPGGEPPNRRSGVAAIGEPDLLADIVERDAFGPEARELRPTAIPELLLELSSPAQQVKAQARNDMIGGETLDGEIASDEDDEALTRVVEAWIRYAHRLKGWPGSITDEALLRLETHLNPDVDPAELWEQSLSDGIEAMADELGFDLGDDDSMFPLFDALDTAVDSGDDSGEPTGG